MSAIFFLLLLIMPIQFFDIGLSEGIDTFISEHLTKDEDLEPNALWDYEPKLAWSLDTTNWNTPSDVSADGKLICYCTDNYDSLVLYNSTSEIIWTKSSLYQILDIDICSSGDFIAVGTTDGSYLFHKNGTQIWYHADSTVLNVEISVGGNFVATASSGFITLLNTSGFIWKEVRQDSNFAVDISSDENCTVIFTDAEDILLYDREGNLDSTVHTTLGRFLKDLAITPNGTFISYTAAGEGWFGFCNRTHEIWNDNSNTARASDSDYKLHASLLISEEDECFYFGGVSSSGLSRYVYCYGFDGTQMWSTSTIPEITMLDLAENGNRLIAAGHDGNWTYILDCDDGTIDFEFELPSRIDWGDISLSSKSYHAVVSTTYAVYYFDAAHPDIDDTEDITYELGSLDNYATVIYEENTPDTYNVEIDSEFFTEGGCNASKITFNIDGFPVGDYLCNVTIIDKASNSNYEIFTIHVDDTTNPTIDSPADLYYEEGMTGNEITWNPFDLDPAWYTIEKDTIVEDGDIWDGTAIVYDVDGLYDGTYSYRCIVYDNEGNSISDTVYVYVEQTENPAIDSPADIVFTEGETGNDITWTPADDYPATYIITCNGTEVRSDIWDGGTISVNLDDLDPGTYSFICTVYDKAGNTGDDEVIVVVEQIITTETGTAFTYFVTILTLISLIPIIKKTKKK